MTKFSAAQRGLVEAALNHYFETVIKKLPAQSLPGDRSYYELLWKECWNKLSEDEE